uniref:Uncharacterized protein n=1 Tax=Glossina palpalis gambiensis TaxID=67801 RepID=A0A1B0B0T4_9MUSC
MAMKCVRNERESCQTNNNEGASNGSSTEERGLKSMLYGRLLYDDKRNETLNETENGQDLIGRVKVCMILNSGSKEAAIGESIRQIA